MGPVPLSSASGNLPPKSCRHPSSFALRAQDALTSVREISTIHAVLPCSRRSSGTIIPDRTKLQCEFIRWILYIH